MPLAVLDGESSKVLIPCDDDSARLEGSAQDLIIAGIRSPFARPQNVMTRLRDLRRKLRRQTVVDQKSH